MRNLMVAAVLAFLGVALATARQNTNNDEAVAFSRWKKYGIAR
jgi:hypothetical protein